MTEAELVGDLANLRFFVPSDRIVGGRYGEETVQQFVPLFVGGDLPEFSGHEIVFGAAE